MILVKRLFTATICSILIAFFLGIVVTSLYDYGFYLFILLLIYLIIGVPTSFFIDRVVDKFQCNQKKYFTISINLVLYTISGLLIGFIIGNFLPHAGLTSSLFKFYIQTGVICSVSFYIVFNVLELIIILTRLLIKK